MEKWTDDFGYTWEVHEDWGCAGQYCTIHNPSDHPLSEAPQRWIAGGSFMVRVCVHNEEHVDRDEQNKRLVEVCSKKCDGCCVFEEKE